MLSEKLATTVHRRMSQGEQTVETIWYPSANDQINKILCIRTMQRQSAVKREKLQPWLKCEVIRASACVPEDQGFESQARAHRLRVPFASPKPPGSSKCWRQQIDVSPSHSCFRLSLLSPPGSSPPTPTPFHSNNQWKKYPQSLGEDLKKFF